MLLTVKAIIFSIMIAVLLVGLHSVATKVNHFSTQLDNAGTAAPSAQR